MNFNQLYKQVSQEEIKGNLFALLGKLVGDAMIITAGKENHYNSMTGSVSGLGILFRKPICWCFLRADRYTLEMIQKEQTYTLSYFPDEQKEQVLFLGSKSGRDSEKMNEVKLTPSQTPSGDFSFKEARLIIECKLTQITTAYPNDFFQQEDKDLINEACKEVNHYRKMVFGEIMCVWIKK